jgi:serine/threonine protein kinase
MAPEIISGDSYKKSSDIYSYAITLWEIITRTIPFEQMRDAVQIMRAVVDKEERPTIDNDNIPIHMKSLIVK